MSVPAICPQCQAALPLSGPLLDRRPRCRKCEPLLADELDWPLRRWHDSFAARAPSTRGKQPRAPRPSISPAAHNPAGKAGPGALVAVLIGVTLVAGASLAPFLKLEGAPAGRDGPVNTPGIGERLEAFSQLRDVEEAAHFFVSFEAPENEVRRHEVAQGLHAVLTSTFGRHKITDTLVLAFCKWGDSENLSGMVNLLDGDGFARLQNPKMRRHVMLTIASFKDEAAAEALSRQARGPADLRDAIDALKTMGPGGKNELAKLVFDGDSDLRNEAWQALASMGARDDEFLNVALGVLADPSHPGRHVAVDYLKSRRTENMATEMEGMVAAR